MQKQTVMPLVMYVSHLLLQKVQLHKLKLKARNQLRLKLKLKLLLQKLLPQQDAQQRLKQEPDAKERQLTQAVSVGNISKTLMKTYAVLLILSLTCLQVNCQVSVNEMTPEQLALYYEHVYGGQPDTNKLLVRNAYVTSYNNEYRIPNWSAYHIIPDFLHTPQRKSKFSKFRSDPDVINPVLDNDYIGYFDSLGYARGHLAPYKIFGGDRDNDGLYAVYSDPNSDADDELTVFEGNYLSNIAPQLHGNFNGSGGLWFKVERWVQDVLVKADSNEVWVYSGCLVHDSRFLERIGPDTSIVVPDQFYKVVIRDNDGEFPDVLVFLFPHYDNSSDIIEKDIFKYLVSVDYIEAISGLNFFNEYIEEVQDSCEKVVNTSQWEPFIE